MVEENPNTSVSNPQEVPVIQPHTENKSKKGLFIIVAFLLILIIAGVYFFFVNPIFFAMQNPQVSNTFPTPSPSFSLKAKVSYLSGTAWKIIEDRRVEIKEEDVLSQGDEIITEKEARMVLSFDDDSVIRVGPNTKINLSQLKSSQMVIEEKNGILFARVNKDKKHQFWIQAGKFTIQSLGTSFSVENDKEVKVMVFESQVNVVDEDKTETQVEENQKWEESKNVVEKISQKEIASDQFLAWSIQEEKFIPTTTPISTPTSAPVVQNSNSSLSLSAKSVSNGVEFNWQVGNINISNGFKIVKNQSGNPSYPADPMVYISDPNTRSYTWDIKDGQLWHFRICQYLSEGKCGVYSNDVSVQAPSGGSSSSTGQVRSIQLTGTKTGDRQVKLTWNIDGNSSMGFKTAWSLISGPTYPPREADGNQWHYLSDPSKRDDTIDGLESGKAYYFRACEYLVGRCGVYSNEVSISL